MRRVILFILLFYGYSFLSSACFAGCLLDNEQLSLSLETYLRNDFVAFKNVVDLDSANGDDTAAYLGIDYSLGLLLNLKESATSFYLKLERNGPYDYDAPLFAHNTLMTSGGVIEEYRNDELLPELEEFWIDAPLADNFRFKLGLFAYEVGNGFSLNGGFENYGAALSKTWGDSIFRLYYCRPDVNHKNHLGPRIRQDEEQGVDYEHNSSNFFAADAALYFGNNRVQPYAGALVDYTSPDKRDNLFSAPIKKDILGTLGCAWNYKADNASFDLEIARNFGRAESASSDYKDISHTGYLLYSALAYKINKFQPSVKFLAASGNKASTESALNEDETLTSAKNRAFSYHSPLNRNLGDSIAGNNADMLPIVAMGGGYGLNYGLPRPGTFAASDFENLIMPCIGLDYQATEKLCLGLFVYYLRSFEKPAGTLNSEGRRLSPDLGEEIDLFIDYQLKPNVFVYLLAGYFIPGHYYKEERDDTGGSILSPYIRGDEKADPAYQIELALEFTF